MSESSTARLTKQAKNLAKLLPDFNADHPGKPSLSAYQELAAKINGYPSFHAAMEREKQRVGDEAHFPGIDHPSDVDRRKLQSQILERLEGLSFADADSQAVAMLDAALAFIARSHPAELDAASKEAILETYPSATNQSVAERAMSDYGLGLALSACSQIARIAIDYSPNARFKADMDADLKLVAASENLQRSLQAATMAAKKEGISSFGVASTTILIGVFLGCADGLHVSKIMRPLVDGMDLALRGGRPSEPLMTEKDAEEAAMAHVIKQMGISRREAKRYLDYAKREMAGRSSR